jgi:hypothetical protein
VAAAWRFPVLRTLDRVRRPDYHSRQYCFIAMEDVVILSELWRMLRQIPGVVLLG